MTRHTTAHYLLEGLMEAGIEYVFSNFGTDHVSIIEELAKWKLAGRSHPEIVICPHEVVAVHMAGGYAAMTGRGQAVMVHVDSGTANAAMSLHNLFRARLPVFLMAGKAPYSSHGELPGSRDNYVHFIQDPFDIGSLVRPYVKWEYNLQSGVTTKEVLQRGNAVMQSDPKGPVYLTLPRETLAEEWDEAAIRKYPLERFGPVAAGGTDLPRARAIAESLMAAKNPIAITSYIGRSSKAVIVLEELARTCGIVVTELNPSYMNFPHDSPCFAGFEPGVAVGGADVGLLLDVDVPWLPKFVQDNPATRWLQVDVDAIKKDLPMWGFPAEVRVEGDCATVLTQVLDIIKAEATADFKARVAVRMTAILAASEKRRQSLAELAAKPGKRNALSAHFVCAMLNKVIRPEDVVVNEAIRNTPAVVNQIMRNKPDTLFGLAGAGLGFSGGFALGVKLARPEARVIQIIGDGGYHFTAPTAVYAVAQRYNLPILTVILDNGGWAAVKEAVLRVYPNGAAVETDDFQARLLGEQRRFEKVGEAFGAHGEYVTEPEQLEAAIMRCLAAMDKGQAAVLNVLVSPI